ncbi:MAG: anthranilate phosphoribosyltransferase [Planctomycetes bacterium]|nr:anthranilate phosphoribosyltransferase [Planctomycetota bacterium]
MSNTEHLLSATRMLKEGKSLTSSEISGAFRVIMSGNAHDGLIGAFLGILATRVPTGEELFGAAVVMKECAKCIDFPDASSLLDTCGTGGAPKTFNVSTAAGIVAAACGVRVAKHGNRSRTGRGSAEVLEQLGINITAAIEQQKRCLEDVGICFCFAPKHHEAVAHVMPVRKSLGFPTIFNLLGPLTNPCSAGRQLLGVWDDIYVEPMAEALSALGTTNSAVAHSLDGLDEISISAPTRILFVRDGSLVEELIRPEDVGLSRWDIKDVTADSLSDATNFIRDSLVEGSTGAPRDMTVLNTSVALMLAGHANTLKEGVKMASEAIDSGAARNTLQNWVEVSNTHISSTDTKET